MSAPTLPLYEEIASIKDYIGAARAIIKDGFMPDMSQLEKRITDLCLSIQTAEADVQGHCLAGLTTLLKSLDDCEQDMRAWKQAQKAAKPQ
jgi:hypothetical protein